MDVVGVDQTSVNVPRVRQVYSDRSKADVPEILGFWSPDVHVMMRHRHIDAKGFKNIYFRGIDRPVLLDTSHSVEPKCGPNTQARGQHHPTFPVSQSQAEPAPVSG